MKFIILILGLVLGIFLGVKPGITQPKPIWWRVLFAVVMTVLVFTSLHPPIAGTFADAVIAGRADSSSIVPVHIAPTKGGTFEPPSKMWTVHVNDVVNVSDPSKTISLLCDEDLYNKAESFQQDVVVYVKRLDNDITFKVEKIGVKNPMFTLPYIMGLEERARIMFYHVPAAWMAFLAYLVSMIFGLRYLKTGAFKDDIVSSSSAAIGTVFCILATVTGAVWAKFNWGKFWNWDPRQTSIFVLLLIYGAYFALRSAIENPVKKARLSSVYSVIGCVAALFFIYVIPRMYDGLHPGSKDSGDAGPVLSANPGTLDFSKQIILSLSYMAFAMLYFWATNLSSRIRILSLKATNK